MAKKRKPKKVSQFVNNQFDFILCTTVILLLALGIIMVLSASSPSALSKTDSSYTYVSKQVLFAVAGIIAMLIISKIDYRFYKKFYKIGYIISILLLIATLFKGAEAKGAERWIDLGFTRFQPSEVVKLLMIVFYSVFLSNRKEELRTFKGFIINLVLLAPILVILVVFQRHLSATLITVAIVSIMMLMAGTKISHFMAMIPFGIAGLAAVIFKGAEFRANRVFSFLDPWADARGTGWQAIQSLYAIGSGGIFGAGLGESKQKYLYISEPHNDFIFAVLAEELGFLGCTFVIVLFGIFIWRGIIIATKAPDVFGSLMAIGITSMIGIQAIINIAVVTSLLPVTGITLPFISYGGTSLLMLLASVGVLLNISRAGSKI